MAATGKPAELARKSRRPAALWLVVAVALAVGQGCQRGPVLGKVHGQVTFQKQPIESGIVGFKNLQTGLHMTANVDAEGRYEVSMAKGRGLPPGNYEVAVYPFVADLPVGSKARPVVREFPNIPRKYRQPQTSELTLSVHEGDNPFDIDMQP
jgi:hypothetical protein